MVDKIILLEDDKQNLQNLNLTYAVVEIYKMQLLLEFWMDI